MLPALAAATAAIDALQALTASKSKSKAATTTGPTQKTANPFDVPVATAATSTSATASTSTVNSSAKASGTISPGTMSALLDAQSQSTAATSSKRADALKSLFGQLDGNGDGQISKAEFEDKLGAGGTNTANADKVFGKLDSDGDGSVSLKELAAALVKAKDKDKKDDAAKGSGDPLLDALQGATSTANADGSPVSITSARKAAASSATSSYNVIEQMIQRQAQPTATSATSPLSISA